MSRPTNEQVVERKRKLSEQQMAYVLWAATPAGVRQPSSQAEFAEVVGVSRPTIWKWSKDPRLQEAVRFVILQHAGDPDHVTQILDMLFEEALAKRDLKYAEVWLRATGVMSVVQRATGVLDLAADLEEAGTGFADFSLEELQRLRDAKLAEALEDAAVIKARGQAAQSRKPAKVSAESSDGSEDK